MTRVNLSLLAIAAIITAAMLLGAPGDDETDVRFGVRRRRPLRAMKVPVDVYLVWRVAGEPTPGREPVAVLFRADDAARMAAALCADEERTRPPHGIARATYHVAPVAFIPSAPGPCDP